MQCQLMQQRETDGSQPCHKVPKVVVPRGGEASMCNCNLLAADFKPSGARVKFVVANWLMFSHMQG